MLPKRKSAFIMKIHNIINSQKRKKMTKLKKLLVKLEVILFLKLQLEEEIIEEIFLSKVIPLTIIID